MTLDEAIARERQLAKEQRSHIGTWDDEYSKKCEVYAEEHEQLAGWLEELKNNRIALEKANGYLEVNHRLGYNKAIDDFISKAEEERNNLWRWDEDEYENGVKAGYQYSIEIAEELKEGADNDN